MQLQFIKKLNNKHLLSLASNASMSLFGLILLGVLYRSLSFTELGKWVFFQSTVLLIDTFRSGFLSTAIIKFYSGASRERSLEVIGSAWFIGLIITIVMALLNIPALFLLRFVNDQGFLLFLKWFGLTLIFTLPSYMASCKVQAEQRFDRLLYIRFVGQTLFIGSILFLIANKANTLQNIIYANLATSLLTSLFTIVIGYSGISALRNRTKSGIKELFHFGKYSVGTSLFSNLFRTSDTLIINFMLGSAPLAIYNLGKKLMELIDIPMRSFVTTAMPALASAYNNNDNDKVVYTIKKYVGMLTIGLIPVCILSLFLADIPIGLLGGGKYVGTAAANVFRLFITFTLLFPADTFFALTIDVVHQPRINFIKVIVMLIVNIAGDFAGIYFLGNIYGVAITTVVPTLIGVLVGYYALRKYFIFSFMDIYKFGYKETIRLLRTQFRRLFPAKAG